MGRLNKQQIEGIVARHEFWKPSGTPSGVQTPALIETCVETGTGRGEQLRVLAGCFENVTGVELNDFNFACSCEAVSDFPCVEVIRGDSSEALVDLCEDWLEEPVFFFLDAHYCHPPEWEDHPLEKSEFPLWKELQLIKDRDQCDIVAVDDVHTFGRVRDDLKFTPDAVEWEGVTTKTLTEFFGDRVVCTERIKDAFVIWLKGTCSRSSHLPITLLG